MGGGQSLPPTRTPVSPYIQGPKTSGLTNFREGNGILGARPRRSPRESKLAGVGGGVRFAEEEVGSGSCGPLKELLAAGAIFKGGKWIFSAATKFVLLHKGVH